MRLSTLVSASLVFASMACAGIGQNESDPTPANTTRVELVVESQNWHATRIFVADGSGHRIARIGMVDGNSTATLTVRRSLLQSSGVHFVLEQFASGRVYHLESLAGVEHFDVIQIRIMPVLEQSY